ncbi:MarR family winged helix-turn-helix transcriptional regulator [Dyadobacter jiangsuensis]|uniref:DNA-binding MarR family transcriptional regulator n=1 Tax=Dyadobacter jiangsuensis TaxID=1591085 RepID=A0A2P8GJ05_9BACT|nr:MarR family winged helix-turn-helix transcriptional regulator [Dyadobacter jiangsuensis]PSL33927.1 DNA-binding MarR family transcriptional regulator [Dyadobacter jiangsuensis]
MTDQQVQQIRSFNRFYTDLLGLLDSHLLDSPYSLAEGRILFEIASNGECRASDIIETLSIDKGYLSRILKKFEKEGLIERKASENDKRASVLSLTQPGMKVFKELDAASNQQIEKITANLDDSKLETLVSSMTRILQILR